MSSRRKPGPTPASVVRVGPGFRRDDGFGGAPSYAKRMFPRLPLVIVVWLMALTTVARAADADADTAQPLQSLPYAPALDLDSLDRDADPCVDFYKYACGGWQQRNPIPPDHASWDVYAKLQEANLRYL